MIKLDSFVGIGDWGLGIGDWGLGPIPNTPSPIPNPHSPIPQPPIQPKKKNILNFINIKLKKNFKLNKNLNE